MWVARLTVKEQLFDAGEERQVVPLMMAWVRRAAHELVAAIARVEE